MSIEKTIYRDTIAERLRLLVDECAGGNAKFFAEKANIQQATFHNYTKGRPPNTESLNNICKSYNVNLNWLITGEGDRYITNSKSIGQIDEDPEIAELLEGARRVLKSGNPVAFDALERNIRYFDHAVATEKRLEAVEEKLETVLDKLAKTSEMKKAANE